MPRGQDPLARGEGGTHDSAKNLAIHHSLNGAQVGNMSLLPVQNMDGLTRATALLQITKNQRMTDQPRHCLCLTVLANGMIPVHNIYIYTYIYHNSLLGAMNFV